MKILSPAKINLMLRILGQRADGYHLLQTYFQLLDWGDDMVFTKRAENTISISGNFANLATQDNLIYQAARLLLPYKNTQQGIHIDVEKRIPQGSGLGGGSSNAGTTLNVLNTLWDCQLSQQKLMQLGLTLGADVPVFVLNSSAMALGIGEKLTPYTLKKHYFVLIFPKLSISTAQVFADKNLLRTQKQLGITAIDSKHNWQNACLPVVLDNFPLVAEIYHTATTLSKTYLSGTGSTLFCCFDSELAATEFMHNCPHSWQTILTTSKPGACPRI